MATSGTSTFDMPNDALVDEAFERCGIDPATITGRHLRSARRSLNLMFADWSNMGIKLWAVDEQVQTVTINNPTYSVAAGTLSILDMVVRRDGTDTEVEPMMRDEYVRIPDKSLTGRPSRYWLDRGTGIYTLWQTPENSTDQIRYYRIRRLQDAGSATQSADVPYQWLEALTSGLTAKLAEKYAPERESVLYSKAMSAFQRAYGENREKSATRFSVSFRR